MTDPAIRVPFRNGGVSVNDRVIFRRGLQLWSSDGTVAGTFEVAGAAPDEPRFHSELVKVGDTALTWATDLFTNQLWTSDGTRAGTRLVVEVPGLLTLVKSATAGGNYFFLLRPASTATYPQTLWKSDGSVAGTFALKEFFEGSTVRVLLAAGDRLAFLVYNAQVGTELWVSDGSRAGTHRLTKLARDEPFSGVLGNGAEYGAGDVIEHDGLLLFLALDVEGHSQLWSTDGRLGAERPIAQLSQFASQYSQGGPLNQYGSRILVSDSQHRIWSSDGTPGGTSLLGIPCRNTSDCSLLGRPIGGGAGLILRRNSTTGKQELWETNGIPGTARRLTTGRPAQFSGSPTAEFSVRLGGQLVFAGSDDESGVEPWVTDGTEAGTYQLADIETTEAFPAAGSLVALDGGVALAARGDDSATGQVWYSDGTLGSLEVKGPEHGCLSQREFRNPTVVGDTLYFSCDGALWRFAANSPEPVHAFDLPGLTLEANEPVVQLGQDLILAEEGSDYCFHHVNLTTGAVTGLLSLDQTNGQCSSELTKAGNLAYFLALDPNDWWQYWRTDGTTQGTLQLTDTEFGAGGLSSLVEFDGAYYFSTFRGLWRTEGTPESTVLLENEVLAPRRLGVLDGFLYFFGWHQPSSSNAIWRSDGTTEGTILLGKAPKLTPDSPTQSWIFQVGDVLLFVMDDEEYGRELWQTDGTPVGTSLFLDLFPGPGSSEPHELTLFGDRLFFRAQTREHGEEIWVTDGTAEGTHLVHDINPGPASSFPRELTLSGDQLFFIAEDGNLGRELWVMDPTSSECKVDDRALCLKDGRFRIEAHWRDFQGRTGFGHAVALTADTGYFWFFNDTNIETVVKVLDGRSINQHQWVFTGALSNVEYYLTVTDTQDGVTRRYFNPSRRFASFGDTLAFGPLGASLKSYIPPAGEPGSQQVSAHSIDTRKVAPFSCAASATRLCLSEGRFAVDVAWEDFQGNTGDGQTRALTDDTGSFWFFNQNNIELVLKVLDGRPINDHFWLFYGALSNVQYTVTVTDTSTGIQKSYVNPSGQFGSVGDTEAFPATTP